MLYQPFYSKLKLLLLLILWWFIILCWKLLLCLYMCNWRTINQGLINTWDCNATNNFCGLVIGIEIRPARKWWLVTWRDGNFELLSWVPGAPLPSHHCSLATCLFDPPHKFYVSTMYQKIFKLMDTNLSLEFKLQARE